MISLHIKTVQCVHVVASQTAVSVCTLLCDAVDAACVLAEVACQVATHICVCAHYDFVPAPHTLCPRCSSKLP
jgi:hypothetical protein